MPLIGKRIQDKHCFVQCPLDRCDCKNGNPIEWARQNPVKVKITQVQLPIASEPAAKPDLPKKIRDW